MSPEEIGRENGTSDKLHSLRIGVAFILFILSILSKKSGISLSLVQYGGILDRIDRINRIKCEKFFFSSF